MRVYFQLFNGRENCTIQKMMECKFENVVPGKSKECNIQMHATCLKHMRCCYNNKHKYAAPVSIFLTQYYVKFS